MIKHAWFKTTLAIAVASASCQLMANGLAINEQSVSGMGTGFAGRSSSAQDASTVFGNPAGMSRLERAEASVGVAAIKANTKISNVDSSVTGTNKGDIAPEAAVPFGYYVRPLNDKWHFGLGVYVPFGVISDYESTSQGRHHGLYSKVQVMTVQPTLSYQINDRVAIGFGPTINKIDGKLTSNPIAALDSPAEVNIKGDDIGYGFNAGILVDVTERLAWGFTYHSKVEYELEGRIRTSGFPTGTPLPVPPNESYKATLDFTSPESADTSVTYKANDKWTLYAGATWTRWSQLDSIVAELKQPLPGFSEVGEELNWEDTWSYAVGVAYQLNPGWVLRGGFTLDESPTSNADRTVRIPVSNRKIVSLGAGWNINRDWTMDFAYSYLRESQGSVDRGDYRADYRNSAHGAGVQLTHRF